MPTSDKIARETLREIEPLQATDHIDAAIERLLEADLPALPVVDARGRYIGIFGEREFMRAIFPAYVDTLSSARMVRRSVDDTIERRLLCRDEEVGAYVTKDKILAEDDFSDTELAETFLHHRVLVVPIATKGRVHAVITRNDFFRELVDRFNSARSECD